MPIQSQHFLLDCADKTDGAEGTLCISFRRSSRGFRPFRPSPHNRVESVAAVTAW
jgi:hypothetical protein